MKDLFQNQMKIGTPVDCLGRQFATDKSRKDFYLELLAKKLEEPEFKELDGFPKATKETILRLSDPPYYTACPNPFVAEFVAHNGKPYLGARPYSREPFTADVSEGKSDPIYNAHGYHTKVPHKAIMRYLLHYTNPGDIVFDGFCGTGMTGVAAQLCGDAQVVASLGYRVDDSGMIFAPDEANGRNIWKQFSKLGPRHAIISDLSPAASFIAHNYNNPLEVHDFESGSRKVLADLREKTRLDV